VGYGPSDRIVPLHTYSTDVEAELRRAVDLFNKNEEFLDGKNLEIAAGYRYRGLRLPQGRQLQNAPRRGGPARRG
jgi:hypothetical protein